MSEEQDQIDAFKYRHMTICSGFKYDDDDSPYDLGNGFIAYWQKGDFGLKRSSMPKNVTAIYQAGNSNNKNQNNYEIDEYGLYWKYSDEYYKQKYFIPTNYN